MNKISFVRWMAVCLASLVLAACAGLDETAEKIDSGYPQARFPSYLKKPQSIEEIMPYAQAAVRQTGGRTPLGQVEPGKTVALFAGVRALVDPNPLVLQAVIEAYKELDVKAMVVLPEIEDNSIRLGRGYTSEDSYMEIARWVGFNFLDQKEPKAWLQQEVPAVYSQMYPEEPRQGTRIDLDPEVVSELKADPNFRFWGGTPKEYLDRYGKTIDIVFTGYGGREGTRKDLGEHGHKFYGNFIFDDYHELVSKVPSYPGDLWRLVEERVIEPLAWADRAHITDAEGTDVTFDVTEQQAKDWAESTYYPGHLFLFPHQGATRLPAVFYPTLTRWIAAFIPKANGVVAGTRSHTGVFPRIEVELVNGRITEVREGGRYGELWRALLDWPKLKEVQYPYYEDIGKGYFWAYETALGTNPKFFGRFDQAMQGRWSTERESAGVIHWGFGVEVRSDQPGEEGRFEQWRRKTNSPRGHGFHIHNMFVTFRVRIRGTERWLTLVEKGRISALDDPEVRLLASRYGDPDEILRAEWVPNIPGISSPGDYQKDYADYPWTHIEKVMAQIEDGTYPYLYP